MRIGWRHINSLLVYKHTYIQPTHKLDRYMARVSNKRNLQVLDTRVRGDVDARTRAASRALTLPTARPMRPTEGVDLLVPNRFKRHSGGPKLKKGYEMAFFFLRKKESISFTSYVLIEHRRWLIVVGEKKSRSCILSVTPVEFLIVAMIQKNWMLVRSETMVKRFLLHQLNYCLLELRNN